MKIIIVNDQYLLSDVPWEDHKRGKNYACLISGPDTKFGFIRKFLEKTRTSTGPAYQFQNKPEAGQIVQVMAIYYTGGGHPEYNPGSGYYRIEKDGSLSEMSEKSVLQSFETVSEDIKL